MLTAEFKKATQYTKNLIKTDLASIILFVASLIPFINFFVLTRYVDKIVSEPSNNAAPPKLVKPNWMELIISLLKIILVGAVWFLVAFIIILPFGLTYWISEASGFTGFSDLISMMNLEGAVIWVAVFIVLTGVSFFAVISEVHMLKNGKRLKTAFAFNDLLLKVRKMGLVRYLLLDILLLAVSAVAMYITVQTGQYIEYFSVSILGIIMLFVMTFFAKTISMLYDSTAAQ